jgi:nickel-dependent lactate racemase
MSGQKQATLRYGDGRLTVEVPEEAAVLENTAAAPSVGDPVEVVRRSLAEPIGSPPLAELVRRKKPRSVAITISDITRPVPNRVILPALLDVLNAEGVADEQVSIIIGTGMHRPSTDVEKDILVGPDLRRRCAVLDHEADDADGLVRISDDPPVSLNRRFHEADFRIVTGLIEPHFMAGYSGGRKGVCPALVDLHTVQRFHGYDILADPKSTNGVIEGNPCHAESLRIAKLVGVDFLVNVTINHERALSGVYAGDMEAAHEAGCANAESWAAAYVDEPFDLVLTNGGGAPLDQTFYQTVKGMVTALPALAEGGTLVIASDCGEGIGSPEYRETMARWHGAWREFLDHIRATGQVVKDQWQYQMHTRVLERTAVERLRLLSDGLPLETQRALAVNPIDGDGPAAERLQRFVDEYLDAHPEARVAVVPEGPYTMLLRR